MRSCSCLLILSVIFLTLSIFIAFYQHKITEIACKNVKSEVEEIKRKPKYILHLGKEGSKTLSAVDDVLQRLGLEKINTTGLQPSEYPKDWDLFWSFAHHDRIKTQYDFTTVKFNQKLNHFPGNYALVSKSVLATKTKLKFIPAAFLTSEEVQNYAKIHPEKRFVIKLKGNRGVKLTKPEDMNFTRTASLDDYFAQEFIEDPLLWNGHKFDFSIFVVITSVNPLRFYYYNKNVNLRFCLKPYNTSNPDDVHSYVIGTEIFPAQEFPGAREYVFRDYTYRDAFEAFMKSKGANLTEIWMKVEDLITQVVITKEKTFFEGIGNFGTPKFSHFELYRFDMIFNENFDLFLMEVNMSPNLLASSKISMHKYFFESVLYNLFNLIGIGTNFEQNEFKFPSVDVELMVAHPNGMTIKPEICLSDTCINNCDDPICNICWHCLNVNEKFERILAYREQMNLGDFKRLFPPNREVFNKLPINLVEENLLEETRKHVEWFFEMCKKNNKFC
ncbi:hypothetical protein PVAND_017089 [Polypedilum vanderplanki]|uniref:Uncharacterized protein n=1 Tax=Polypedilum vanderplanki TaxID=319348 RepID=A0A9J6BH86_POLVA|nr:hypothetical protein PVAND_017089 [Polypedilum vanderplanki]